MKRLCDRRIDRYIIDDRLQLDQMSENFFEQLDKRGELLSSDIGKIADASESVSKIPYLRLNSLQCRPRDMPTSAGDAASSAVDSRS